MFIKFLSNLHYIGWTDMDANCSMVALAFDLTLCHKVVANLPQQHPHIIISMSTKQRNKNAELARHKG